MKPTFFFTQELIFINKKYISNRVYSDRSELDLPDDTIKIQNFPLVESYDEKNCWKLPKLLRCRKAPTFKTFKDIDPKF